MKENELEILPGVTPEPLPEGVYEKFLEDYRSEVPPKLKHWRTCLARSKHPNGILPPVG
jgi:hypothetical protein